MKEEYSSRSKFWWWDLNMKDCFEKSEIQQKYATKAPEWFRRVLTQILRVIRTETWLTVYRPLDTSSYSEKCMKLAPRNFWQVSHFFEKDQTTRIPDRNICKSRIRLPKAFLLENAMSERQYEHVFMCEKSQNIMVAVRASALQSPTGTRLTVHRWLSMV